MKKVVVIGAGASGLVAAIFAARSGQDVTLLEKNKICGKKLLATGNGRCNYWNEDQTLEHYRSSNFNEVCKILTETNKNKILQFFYKIGIEPKIKNGYYYPFSNQAISMQKALILEAEKLKVNIKNNMIVTNIKKIKDKFKITVENGDIITADKVIVSTGSKAAPKTGSDGIGYKICKEFNHSIIKPLPALVQLKADEKFLKHWEGIRCDAEVTYYENNKKQASEQGELQLTNYGISGICVFNLSGRIARGLENKNKQKVQINFLHGLNIKTNEQFIKWMDKRNNLIKNRTIFELLEGILNYKLVNVLLDVSNLNSNSEWSKLNDNEKFCLAKNIVAFNLNIIGTNSYDKAQVCSGGIPLNEINVTTMESKIVKGLYITGELLDVDGDCGGYNLEWAWVTGMIAGSNL